MEKKQSTWQERFREKFKAPEWAPQKMQEIFNELMFGSGGVEDFVSSEREALLKELVESVDKIPEYYMDDHGKQIVDFYTSYNNGERIQALAKKLNKEISLTPMPKKIETRNSKVLADFTAYCEKNPDQRFWQALRNWSGAEFINYERKGDQLDTFYWENITPDH